MRPKELRGIPLYRRRKYYEQGCRYFAYTLRRVKLFHEL